MNGMQRVMAVLQGELPDRVPTFEWSISDAVVRQSNVWPRLGWGYPELIDLLDIDGVVAWPLLELTPIGDSLFRDEAGVIRKQGHEDYAVSMDEYAPLRNEEELERYSFPDPERELGWLQLKHLVKLFKGERAIIMKLRDVFSWPRDLRGYENLLMDLALNPGLVERLVRLSVEYAKRQAEIAVSLGAEIIMFGDDIASNNSLIFSPESYRRIFLPGFKELVGHVKKLGAFVIKHTDGNISAVIDDFVEAGIDCIDPVDPMGGMSIKEVKGKYGDGICIKGNASCSGILDGNDKNAIIEETKRCLQEGMPGGRYIFSSSNSIHSGISFSNYRLMLNTLREFGNY